MLPDKGAEVNFSKFGNEGLFLRAAKQGYTKVLQLLLERGADPNIKNKRGQTPLDVARSEENAEVVNYL